MFYIQWQISFFVTHFFVEQTMVKIHLVHHGKLIFWTSHGQICFHKTIFHNFSFSKFFAVKFCNNGKFVSDKFVKFFFVLFLRYDRFRFSWMAICVIFHAHFFLAMVFCFFHFLMFIWFLDFFFRKRWRCSGAGPSKRLMGRGSCWRVVPSDWTHQIERFVRWGLLPDRTWDGYQRPWFNICFVCVD